MDSILKNSIFAAKSAGQVIMNYYKTKLGKKFLMLLPNALPISGSFPAPKMIIIITKMIINSGKPMPIIMRSPYKVINVCFYLLGSQPYHLILVKTN